MLAMLAAGDLASSDLPDCCNDLQTFAATGHLCKPDTDGSAPVAISPMGSFAVGVDAPASDPPQAGPVAAFSAPTATPWRPPAGS